MSDEDETGTPPNRPLFATLGIIALVLVSGAVALVYALPGGIGQQAAHAECALDDDARTRLAAAAQGQMAAFTVADTPRRLDTLAFQTRDGGETSLKDWRGRVALVNLWATWCAPCRAEMPALDALQRDRGSEGFEVVPISLDMGDAQKPKDFYEEIDLKSLAFYHDGTLATLNTLKAEGLAFGLPATLLIDGRGCVVGTLNGPAHWDGEDAHALIDAVRPGGDAG